MDDYINAYKRAEDVANDELNEKKERLYNKLYPSKDHTSDAVQLEFDLNVGNEPYIFNPYWS